MPTYRIKYKANSKGVSFIEAAKFQPMGDTYGFFDKGNSLIASIPKENVNSIDIEPSQRKSSDDE